MRRIWLGAVMAVVGVMLAPTAPVQAEVTCDGKRATIKGNAGANTIHGTEGADVIAAGAGDDVVHALGGNDIVCLGSGADVVFGGTGSDGLDGGPGDDRLYPGPGDDVVNGGDGNDAFSADAAYDGFDAYNGSTGFDTLAYVNRSVGLTITVSDAGQDPAAEDVIGTDVDEILGSSGNDTITVSSVRGHTVQGGDGDDFIDGTDGVAGNDRIVGNYGVDQCHADDGDLVQACP